MGQYDAWEQAAKAQQPTDPKTPVEATPHEPTAGQRQWRAIFFTWRAELLARIPMAADANDLRKLMEVTADLYRLDTDTPPVVLDSD